MADQEPQTKTQPKGDHDQHAPDSVFDYVRELLRTPGTGRTVLVALAAILAGVTGLMLVKSWISIVEHAVPAPPLHVTGYDLADSYCQQLGVSASDLSAKHSACGWLLTAVVLVGFGVTVTRVRLAEDRVVFIGVLSVLGVVGLNVLRRADAAGELTVAATEARTFDRPANAATTFNLDKITFDTCAKAWAAWIKSRSESNAIARAALEESVKGLKQANDKAVEAKSTAQDEADKANLAVDSTKAVVDTTKGAVDQQSKKIEDIASQLDTAKPASSAAKELRDISAQLKTTVKTAADTAAVSAASTGASVIFAGTDGALTAGCDNVRRVTQAGFSASLYGTGNGTWITIVGPYPTRTAADANLKEVRAKANATAYIGRLQPTWSLVTCGQ